MSTAPVTTLIDEQIADIERSLAIIGFGIPVHELLGHPREYRVQDLPKRLAVSMKGKRVAVRVRP